MYLFLQLHCTEDEFEWFHIDPPATPEKIYLASNDPIMRDILSKNANIADDEEVAIQT